MLVQGPLYVSGVAEVPELQGPRGFPSFCVQLYIQATRPFTGAKQLCGQGKPLGAVTVEGMEWLVCSTVPSLE